MPLQHADDRVLKLMNRRGTGKQYLELIKKLKEKNKTEENVTDEKQTKADIDFQIRFAVEHSILPSKINQEPIYMITSVIAEKGAFINNYYRVLYAQQKQQSPYTFEEFNVSVPFEIAGANVVCVEMPEKNLKNTLCKRVYLIYNKNYTKHLFVTVECFNEQLKMCMWVDQEHEYVADINDNEYELLEHIITDEEIAEESYSDVLESLMKEAKNPEPLLTEPAQIQEHSKIFLAALMQVQKLKQDNKREDATKLIREIIKKEAIRYEDSDLIEYHSFRNSFEVLLYANLFHPYNPEKQEKKQIIGTQVDLASAYLVYGIMMLEQRQYDKAIDIFWEGLKINPVNVQLLFALSDAYKGKNYLKSYFAVISRAHSCAIRKTDIARIYRSYAYYYTQIKDFDTAVSLVYAAKYFDAQGFTQSLREIEQISEKTFQEPNIDELKNTLSQKGIFWGAKELTVSVVSLLDKEYTQSQNQQGIKMCAELKKELSFEN